MANRKRERQKARRSTARHTIRARDLGRPPRRLPATATGRELITAMADYNHEWAGLPIPVEGFRLTLEDRYPRKAAFEEAADLRDEPDRTGEETVTVVNQWFSRVKQGRVILYRQDGVLRVVIDRRERQPGMRLTFWLNTVGAAGGWDPPAEARAVTKLRELVTDHAFNTYLATGTFLETSPRSGVTYMFRRCRPTVAIVPSDRHDDTTPMRLLAVLCMHPIGLYTGTWAGAMVPTDDVVAHLLWMRADEHGYWRRANQHRLDAPEAGL